MKAKRFDLEERLVDFAVQIVRLASKLPTSYEGRHLKNQVTRSGTSPALNYGEAQAAESRADFIHKMKICLKELRETQICLKIIAKVPLYKGDDLIAVMKESDELVAIFTKSVKSATTKTKS